MADGDGQRRRRVQRGVGAGVGVCVLALVAIAAVHQEAPPDGATALAAGTWKLGARRQCASKCNQCGKDKCIENNQQVIEAQGLAWVKENCCETLFSGAAARTAELSEADLFRRSGAAENIVAAQNGQKAAAAIFVKAVEDETRTTRELAMRAQFAPDSMTSASEGRAIMMANEAEIKRLGNLVKTFGQVQIQASASYVSEGQKRYAAVDALQSELRQEAQAAYDIKVAVVGTDASRFDPTSEGAAAFNPNVPKQDTYHVARLRGVDSDGTQSLCGRAEVKHDNQWGSICSRGFTPASAEMFCKTMGLTGGKARYYDDLGNPTWDDTVITRMDPGAQPDAAVSWMAMVTCAGTETNVLECPFGESSEAQDWRHYNIKDGCDSSRGVGLCCDVSDFCPPRSNWRPDPVQDEHAGQMYGGNMHPQQAEPEVIANCKCDAGFYMVASSVYSGKCTTCPLNACSSYGSTNLDDCFCLEGFFKAADGSCSSCPANSCSSRGVDAATGIDGCKCFAGYYMSGGACVMCPEARTSKAGSTSADECDTLCGLPDSATAGEHAEKIKKAAFDVAQASDAMRAAADAFVGACKAETDALEKMSAELTYEPPATLSKEAIAGYASDVTNLQEDANLLNKYVPIVRTSGALQVASTTSYLAEGDKLKDAVVKLQEAFQDQMTTEHHIKEALTRCQPTVACIPSPCGEVEPSNPCEPWPSCYPHPCHPWPSCSTLLHGGSLPDIDAADPVAAAAPANVSPLDKATQLKNSAKTPEAKAAAQAAVDAALKAYDAAAGFNLEPNLHYYTSDDSFDAPSGEASQYMHARGALENAILKKIEGRVDTAASTQAAATGPHAQLRVTGEPTPGMAPAQAQGSAGKAAARGPVVG